MSRPHLVFGVGILLAAAGALALRLPGLERRPMHPDEGNQAVKTGILLEAGEYRYDPRDHHGPTLYYLTLPALRASGAERFAETSERPYRIVPALFGVGVVLLFWLLGDGLGRPAALAAALLAAVSPAMVYYSRCYIQETLLVFFMFAFLACVWRYARTRSGGWLLAAGACLGLAHATKETWVLAAGAMAAALAGALAWTRRGEKRGAPLRKLARPRLLAGAAAVAAAVSLVFFTSFFTHARGPLDSLLAYWYYLADRAPGAGLHDHPWHFYLHRLLWFHEAPGPVWSEGLIVGLALVGVAAAVTGRGVGAASLPLLRFLALYTLAVTAAYALIPYKTPWCVVTQLHGMILLAGVGAAALVRWVPWPPARALLVPLLAAGAFQLGWQSWRTSHSLAFFADPRNPYVYAHTSTNLLRLADRMEELAALDPRGHDMVVKVVTPENYWPLPWYLRRFRHVGYWDQVPEDPDAAVVITTPDVSERLEARLRGAYDKRSRFGLRPGVLVTVYVEQPLWDRFIESRAGPAGPRPGAPR